MEKAMCYDHFGKPYKSIQDMCEYYGMRVSTYKSRIQSGWSIEKALTTPVDTAYKNCIDHLGKPFNSITEMCRHYNISPCTFQNRINKGWSLGEALTTPAKSSAKGCKDHLGKSFKSISDMCKHWGINNVTFNGRIELGWSLEKALTTPIKQGGENCKDHLGKPFQSISDMCKHWGIKPEIFSGRIKSGWSLEEALTTPVRQAVEWHKDHLGNKYRTIDEMCNKHGITKSAYKYRINQGWSLEKTLTTPMTEANRRNGVDDHLGNHYQNIETMCKHYNRSIQTFFYRIRQGWTLEAALTEGLGSSAKVVDGFGNSSCSFTELAIKYAANYDTLRDRVKRGIEVCVALICKEYVELGFVGLDGRARYRVKLNENELYTARELIDKFRPDLLPAYDKHNPTGKYEPYNGE